MRVSFTVFTKSALATIVNIIGVLMMALGISYFIKSIAVKEFSIISLVLILIGIVLILISPKINKYVVAKKTKKSYEDEKLINLISSSSIAAYSLFLSNPCSQMLEFINIHNSFAATKIEKIIHKQITEDEAIVMLRQKDEENNIKLSCSSKGLIYSNSIFELYQVYTINEKNQSFDEKSSKKEKRYKTSITILAVLILMCLVTVLVSSFFVTEKNAAPYDANDDMYSVINIVSLEPSMNEFVKNGAYYEFTGENGENGTLVFDEKALENEAVKMLISKESANTLAVYGRNIDIEKKSFIGTITMGVFEAKLEPENEFPLSFAIAFTFGLWLIIAELIVVCKYGKEKKNRKR